MKEGILNEFHQFTEKHLRWSHFLIEFRPRQPEETPTQLLFCEFRETLKNKFLTEHLWTHASVDARDAFSS